MHDGAPVDFIADPDMQSVPLHVSHTDSGVFWHLSTDHAFHDSLKAGRSWDDSLLQVVLPFVSRHRNVVDVGGHIGTHAVVYAKHTSGRVTTYEPQRLMHRLLRQNIEANGCSANVVVRHAAVGHTRTVAKLADAIADGMSAGAAIAYESRNPQNFGGVQLGDAGESTEQVALDDEDLGDVGFVKVDVEGAEPLVFFGAQKLFQTCRPVVLFEQNHKRLSSSAIRSQQLPPEVYGYDFVGELARLGYSSPLEVTEGNFLMVPTSNEATASIVGLWRDESGCPYLVFRDQGVEVFAFSPEWVPNLFGVTRIDGQVAVIGRFGSASNLVVGSLTAQREIRWSNGGLWQKHADDSPNLSQMAALFRYFVNDVRSARACSGTDVLSLLSASRLDTSQSWELTSPDLDGAFVVANPTLFRLPSGQPMFGARVMNWFLEDRRDALRGARWHPYLRSLFSVGNLVGRVAVTTSDPQALGLIRNGPPSYDPRGCTGLEDVKAISCTDGVVRGLATVVNWRTGVQEMVLASLDERNYLRDVRHIHGEMVSQNRNEKNWMPVELHDGLYAVYSVNPLCVLKIHDDGLATAIHHGVGRHDLPKTMRGSSPGVRWAGSKFLFVVHDVNECKGLTAYHHRFICMDLERFSVEHVSMPFYFQGQQVEFCCGLLDDGPRILLSYAIGDARAFVAQVDKHTIQEMLLSGSRVYSAGQNRGDE